MSSVRLRLLTALVLLVFPFCAGCGAETAEAPAGAEIAPASAELFISVDTSFDSPQWDAVRDVVAKFPDGDRGVQFLLDSLDEQNVDFEQDVQPALGPETDVVGLDLTGQGEFVGLTKPDDKQKLEDLLAESNSPTVMREIGGWTAFADSEVILDEFETERAKGTLDGAADFESTMGGLPGDALARGYVNGEAIERSLAEDPETAQMLQALVPGTKLGSTVFSLRAEQSGARLEGLSHLPEGDDALGGTPFRAELPNEVPAGAILYVGFNDLESGFSQARDALAQADPAFDHDLAQLEAQIGVSLEEDVLPLFSGEGAVYVRPGFPIPEVTLVTQVADEAAAVATVDKVVAALGRYAPLDVTPTTTEIAGVQAKQVTISPPFSLYYAAFDGHLVLTTSSEGIAALRGDGERLADDARFKNALEAAGVPEETTGFAYVDVHSAVTNLLGLAEMGGGTLPSDVRPNLEPLQSLVFYASRDGDTVRFTGFLAVD
jgi:Protein of unknown function (DUF3352)